MAAAVLVIFVCSFFCCRGVLCQIDDSSWNSDKFKEEAAQTFNLVFHKYNHRVRPPVAYIDITVNITLRHIRHLDLHRQELQTVLDVEMYWTDARLQWYPVKVQQISANISNVWVPDIVYTNSVAETKVLYPGSAKITHKGYVTWTRKEVVTTFCATEPSSKKQNCTLILGFVSNSRNDQTDRFFSNMSSFTVPSGFSNHEWILVDSELGLEPFDNDTRSHGTVMEVNLSLRRRPNDGGSQTGSINNEENSSGQKTPGSCVTKEESEGKHNDGSRTGGTVISVALILFMTAVIAQSPVFWVR